MGTYSAFTGLSGGGIKLCETNKTSIYLHRALVWAVLFVGHEAGFGYFEEGPEFSRDITAKIYECCAPFL
jgi:hypothetical protein